MKSEFPTSWYLLAESYLYTANLLADEVHELCIEVLHKRQEIFSLIHLIPLTFSSIFNTRHGIELFLKSLIAIQKDSELLERKYQTHSLTDLFEFLEKGQDGLVQIFSITPKLEGVSYKDDLDTLKAIVVKYQNYNFRNFPAFIKVEDFKKADPMNMFFRYPDKSSMNEAARFLFDEHFNSHGDIDSYLERNFKHLYSIIELTKEIKSDVRDMFRINQNVGNTVAAHAKENGTC
jgi:hypothetical protein